MREIIELSGELMDEEKMSDPLEGFSYIADNHLLEKHTCHDPDLEVVAHILRQAVCLL